MRRGQRVAAAVAATTVLMGLGMGAAWAAASGAVNLAVTGASMSSTTYRYDVLVPGTTTNQKGILYYGTLQNTGSADTNTAYFYAQVEGYGFAQLARATYHTNAGVNKVLWDPAAVRVRYSQAQVCRDRVFQSQNCKVGTYNY